MKNIHLLPTDNYSPLVHSTNKYGGYFKSEHYSPMKEMGDSYQHIYITSDEEIKAGDWYYLPRTNLVYECTEDPTELNLERSLGVRKIILTTDPDLIKDGVQPIDDKFLEWFVKNPSCEEVEIELDYDNGLRIIDGKNLGYYSYIIPKEEPEQETVGRQFYKTADMVISVIRNKETLEEAAKGYSERHQDVSGNLGKYLVSAVFQDGAKWQSERIENESEQLINELESLVKDNNLGESYRAGIMTSIWRIKKWFEQFKKK